MAKPDYTDYLKYLGNEVTFFAPIEQSIFPIDSYQKITGLLHGVVFHHVNPSESEFFVGDNTYSFSDVVFISSVQALIVDDLNAKNLNPDS